MIKIRRGDDPNRLAPNPPPKPENEPGKPAEGFNNCKVQYPEHYTY